MTDLVVVPQPGDPLARPSAENLTNALEHIRIAAALHYAGGAFDPEHMRGICNLAVAALNGEDIPPLPNPEQIRSRAVIWEALADGDPDE